MTRIRSTMFVPANKPELAVKATSSNADVICLDLEDGVAPTEKSAARANLAAIVSSLNSADKTCWVRVNSELELLVEDIIALPEGVDAVMLPKTRDMTHVDLVCELISRSSKGLDVGLVALVEDVHGVRAFAGSSRSPNPSLVALALGVEDLSATLGAETGSRIVESLLLELLTASRLLGVQCLGYAGTISEFRDLEAFARPLVSAARSGVAGGLCIHPAQIEALNTAFSVDPDRLSWAREVVDAFEKAGQTGVINVGGKMVDLPVYLQAKALCDR